MCKLIFKGENMFNKLTIITFYFIITILIFSSSTLAVGTNPNINFDGDLKRVDVLAEGLCPFERIA